MAEALTFSIDLPVSTERVYRAWLDPYEHSQFTHQPAQIGAQPGSEYSALDGEVTGKVLVTTPFTRIVQTWRAQDFPAASPDSQVELKLEPTCLGSQLTIFQTDIPDGQTAHYLALWETRYFRPLLAYFEALVGDASADMDG